MVNIYNDKNRTNHDANVSEVPNLLWSLNFLHIKKIQLIKLWKKIPLQSK